MGKSLSDMIMKVMEGRVDGGNEKKGSEGGVERVERRRVGDLCPQCGELSVVRVGNCMYCRNCGYSTC
jgi:predicted RNA-binding Zn-ribbon protein involved in translation (DUF1610 family)